MKLFLVANRDVDETHICLADFFKGLWKSLGNAAPKKKKRKSSGKNVTTLLYVFRQYNLIKYSNHNIFGAMIFFFRFWFIQRSLRTNLISYIHSRLKAIPNVLFQVQNMKRNLDLAKKALNCISFQVQIKKLDTLFAVHNTKFETFLRHKN